MSTIEPRRRWFRFRVQTLLIAIAVFAIPLAWVAKERRQSRYELGIADELRSLGFERIVLAGPYDSADYGDDQQGVWRNAARFLLGERIVGVDLISWPPEVLRGTPRPAEMIPEWARIKAIPPLAGLTRLEYLSLCHTGVSDLTPIAGLENLRSLVLDFTPVSDLTPIAGLKKLETLELRSTPVTDLAPLAGLKSLQYLSLDNSKVNDLAPVASLANLDFLSLNSTAVRDLTPLARTNRLRELQFVNTPINDLTPLASLHRLTLVSASNTHLTDLTPLAGITNLHGVSVQGVPVTKEQVEALKKALPECSVFHSPFP